MNISEMILKYDPENEFQVLIDSYKQIEYAWNNQLDVSSIDKSKIKNIILTGLGGSAIGGDLIQNYFRTELNYPYTVNRNYDLPLYADNETLVIASSYSGNTEETLSALNQAIEKKSQIICVTTGGKMEEIARTNNIPVIILQKGFQPRYALWINFFSVVKALHSLKLVPDQNENVKQAIDLLKRKGKEHSGDHSSAVNLAENMIGFLPLIYAVSDYTSVVATRLKGQFNENSKQHAFFNNLPELDHNEIMGWESFKPQQANIKLINILDDDYNPQIKKRFTVSSDLIAKAGAEIINLKSEEPTSKLRLIDLIYLGDWTTYYFAIIRAVNPTAIENINYLKAHL